MKGKTLLLAPALAGFFALALGCKTSVTLERSELPMHVAVIPVTQPTVGHAAPGEHEGEETELRVVLAGQQVTRAVSAALEKYCFARVSVLELEDGEGAVVDEFERQRALLALAREHGSDLIVELDLRYDAEIYRKITSTFWLNYPLFLFFGPSNWFLPDNTYLADVELKATVYDLHAMDAGDLALGDAAAEVLAVSARFGQATLDFTDRSRGLGDYGLGILLPSGFLARETDETAEGVHDAILESLQTQLVQGIQNRRADLVRADWIAPLFLEPADVSVRREGDDLRVQGSVRLRRDGLADRVHAVHVEAGTSRVSLEPALGDFDGASESDVFVFDAILPHEAAAHYLRLELEAGSRDRYVRSYTFCVPRP